MKNKNLEAKKQKDTQSILQTCKLYRNLTNCETHCVTRSCKSLKVRKQKLANESKVKKIVTKTTFHVSQENERNCQTS